MYIDVHCHLDILKDPEKALEIGKKTRVEIIVANGTDYESNRKILELSAKHGNVKAALGVYPIDALKMSKKGIRDEIDFILKNKEKIAGIGEVGLDFKESDEKPRQEEIFIDFINLAKSINKPIIVHSRKAEERCVEILERSMAKKVIMHCFCGKKKEVQRIIENGWFLSIPGNVVYNSQFKDIVKETPISNLLCETDSPFLHPEKSGENSPANVVYSYEEIARLKNIPLKEVEAKIEANYRRLFDS